MDIRAGRYYSLTAVRSDRAVHLLLLLQSPASHVAEQQLCCEEEQTDGDTQSDGTQTARVQVRCVTLFVFKNKGLTGP